METFSGFSELNITSNGATLGITCHLDVDGICLPLIPSFWPAISFKINVGIGGHWGWAQAHWIFISLKTEGLEQPSVKT